MPKLLISVDPGFDTMKVIANGAAFKFPFNVVETDERKMSDYRLRDDFILYQNDIGTTYRVGQYARELVYDNKSKVDGFYTEERFISDEFQVGMDTAIALAIEKNGFYDMQHDLDIHIMVALPHACRSKYAATIMGAITGRHKFMLRCGQGRTKGYDFSVPEDNIHTVSQTIAAKRLTMMAISTKRSSSICPTDPRWSLMAATIPWAWWSYPAVAAWTTQKQKATPTTRWPT